jgi:hypothetical protein
MSPFIPTLCDFSLPTKRSSSALDCRWLMSPSMLLRHYATQLSPIEGRRYLDLLAWRPTKCVKARLAHSRMRMKARSRQTQA